MTDVNLGDVSVFSYLGNWSYPQNKGELPNMLMTSIGDASRLMEWFGDEVLISLADHHSKGEEDESEMLLLNTRIGVWTRASSNVESIFTRYVDRFGQEVYNHYESVLNDLNKKGRQLKGKDNKEEDRAELQGQMDDIIEVQELVQAYTKKIHTTRRANETIAFVIGMVRAWESAGYESVAAKRIKNKISVCYSNDVDDHMNALVFRNGVVDLMTGEMLDPNDAKLLYITKECSADVNYKPEISESAQEAIDSLLPTMEEESKVALFAEIGYSLRGYINRRFLFILGASKAGKTTFINALESSFGSYVQPLHASALASSKYDNDDKQPHLKTIMKPVRLAYTEEAEKVSPSSDKLKLFTGDAKNITYRQLRSNPRSETPTATILMIANQTPRRIGLSDEAILDRIRPFEIPSGIDRLVEDESINLRWQTDKEWGEGLAATIVAHAVKNMSKPKMTSKSFLFRERWKDEDKTEEERYMDKFLFFDPNASALKEHVWQRYFEYTGDTIRAEQQRSWKARMTKQIIERFKVASYGGGSPRFEKLGLRTLEEVEAREAAWRTEENTETLEDLPW